jgi:uncharacterized membrane protein YjjP (DUF1212 family)
MSEAPPGDTASIDFVLALGRALHRYGTPAHRLEEAISVVCGQLGLAAEVFSTPTTLIMSFGAPAELRTRMMRVDDGQLDLAKLARVDALADAVAARKVSVDEGSRRLAAIVAAPPTYDRFTSFVAHGVTAGAVAVFFGGAWADVGAATVIGLGLGILAQLVRRSTAQARVFELVGAMYAAFAAGVAAQIAPVSASLVTIASLIALLPGMSLTVAMTELATRNLIAGTTRLMAAVIVLLQLAVGVAVGERLARELVGTFAIVPAALPEWAQWSAVVTAALAMAVVVQAERRAVGWILGAALLGFVGTRYGTAWLGGQLGVLVGAFALGALANVFARLLDRPAQVVIIPAAMLLVPGSMGFRGMTSLIAHDTLTGVETVFAMFVVAIAIVGGLLLANATVSPRRSL